ncbi:apurinic endonuclease-like protein [Coleophoma crateriformis]|uniref:Apurinic-apyrimidinic endonuclease 1 n=1 Tax=Coleophoma crateriformis TaxID=565419 RepID=A0A3D8RVC7_9HELO|nr:apurinic endonuclease-like protein [Coleophoma crateriformis]
MSRRSARGAEKLMKSETIASIAKAVAPKKGRTVKVETDEVLEVVTPAKSSTKKQLVAEDASDNNESAEELEPAKSKTIPKKKAGVKVEPQGQEGTKSEEKTTKKRKAGKGNQTEDKEDASEVKVTKKRKTKEEKEAEAAPILERTPISSLKKPYHIGAHVSGAGGVQNSINNALHIGGNSFALFLKSQRKWTSPPLAPEARDQFKAFCLEHKYDAAKHVLPHGSYLVNLAQADAEKAEQAYSCFLDDLHRCEALGIMLYNFHPGNTGPNPRPEAIARIAQQLNKAHKATKTVVTVLENMAGGANVIGSTWEDLREIIALIDDKSRVGVCIDTCHTFAAGYDLRTPESFKSVMDDFTSIVGIKYLKALHLNDSKAPFNSHRDLHANIGTGFLGLRAFHNIMNFAPFQGLPMVLETPIDKKDDKGKSIEDKGVWAAEIKLLEGLIDADPETEVFKKEEQRLQDLGAEERKKFQGQADKKNQKTIDAMFKKGKKTKTKKEDANDSDGSEGGCSH